MASLALALALARPFPSPFSDALANARKLANTDARVRSLCRACASARRMRLARARAVDDGRALGRAAAAAASENGANDEFEFVTASLSTRRQRAIDRSRVIDRSIDRAIDAKRDIDRGRPEGHSDE